MAQDEIDELESLISRYNAKHGERRGDEISGALMFSLSIADQIQIFKRARGREIILKLDPDAIDGVLIQYKSSKRPP